MCSAPCVGQSVLEIMADPSTEPSYPAGARFPPPLAGTAGKADPCGITTPLALSIHSGYAAKMRSSPFAILLGLALPSVAAGQTACVPAALPDAAKIVLASQHALQRQAVIENDPAIPSAVASGLGQFKDALAGAAAAAFACAGRDVTPEQMGATLAQALHANAPEGSDTMLETRGKHLLGAYGTDLQVQVLPLNDQPKYFEVDFRYSIACGDDNLLLVFTTEPSRHPTAASPAASPWRLLLRWDAPRYTHVGEAFGDFVLLTPLSGVAGSRNWRFVVAHGRPGCGTANTSSRFDLDVLQPTADPTQPEVVWHGDHPYGRAWQPRLSTTEGTITFELNPPPSKALPKPVPAQVLRYRISANNHVEPLLAEEGEKQSQ